MGPWDGSKLFAALRGLKASGVEGLDDETLQHSMWAHIPDKL